MDYIKGQLIYPFYFVYRSLLLVAALVVISLPALVELLRGRAHRLLNFVNLFSFLSSYPLGTHLLSAIIGFFAPYSSSISPTVHMLRRDGDTLRTSVSIDEQLWLRNPFRSIHAVALTNLGELCTGLCMVSALQYDASLRGIPINISTTYLKKARSHVTATCALDLPIKVGENKATCAIVDRDGNIIATCDVTWVISEKDKKKVK